MPLKQVTEVLMLITGVFRASLVLLKLVTVTNEASHGVFKVSLVLLKRVADAL